MNKLQPIEKLTKNWGVPAESLSCNAELRFFDPKSEWQCFILAVNPRDHDEICSIISTNLKEPPSVTEWTWTDLQSLFNADGEKLVLDTEFRPMQASVLFKKLNAGILWTERE